MGILRPCAAPHCPALVKRGRCPAHVLKDTRPSARKRGYDKVWEEIRAQVLAEVPACEIRTHCQGAPATAVDHCNGNPWDRTRSNLRAACESCHNARTARDQGRSEPGWKRHAKTHAPPVFG